MVDAIWSIATFTYLLTLFPPVTFLRPRDIADRYRAQRWPTHWIRPWSNCASCMPIVTAFTPAAYGSRDIIVDEVHTVRTPHASRVYITT